MNDLFSRAIERRVNTSESLYNLSLLGIGALAALVFAKKDEVRIGLSDKYEICSAICGFLLLLSSTAFYYIYWELIVDFYHAGAQLKLPTGQSAVDLPDIFDHKVEVLFNLQGGSVICGIIVVFFTIVSAYWLKKHLATEPKELS